MTSRRAHRNGPSSSTILVPIRYPLTAESTRTLEYAGELADREGDAELKILHVNLSHFNQAAHSREINQAIAPIVGEYDPEVIVQNGFLVEEMITEEALRLNADIIILGGNRRPRWRRALSRLLWNDPDIPSYLQANVEATVEIAV